jgi:hypothetical protein
MLWAHAVSGEPGDRVLDRSGDPSFFPRRCSMSVSVGPVTEEPLGIVISRGQGEDPRPAFWAYVWGEEEKKVVVRK